MAVLSLIGDIIVSFMRRSSAAGASARLSRPAYPARKGSPMTLPDWFVGSSEEAGFLRLVLDHVSDCLVAVDTTGTIVLINEPYCRLLGGDANDFLGRHITEVVGRDTKLHLVAR